MTRLSEISAFLRELGCTDTESHSFNETTTNWRYESADFALVKFSPRTITLPVGFYYNDGTVYYRKDSNGKLDTVSFNYENDSLLDIKAQILKVKKEFDDAQAKAVAYFKRLEVNAKKREIRNSTSDWEI
jgi:hypothetical protein